MIYEPYSIDDPFFKYERVNDDCFVIWYIRDKEFYITRDLGFNAKGVTIPKAWEFV